MKFAASVLWSLSIIVLGACSQDLHMSSQRWSQEGLAPSRPQDLSDAIKPLEIQNRKLIFQTQEVEGAPVEGSFYKEILVSDEPQFIVSNWADSVPSRLKAQILLMKAQKTRVATQFSKKYPEYASEKLVMGPQLIVQEKQPRWKLVFRNADGTLKGVFLDHNYEIQKETQLGSHFQTATATVFPEGPLKSRLEDVVLKNLTSSKALITSKIKILSQSPSLAIADDLQFRYPPEDKRFEQVQAFFYISEALSWSERKLSFILPFQLKVETQVGYPDKTNTAFYYSQGIHLGDGDDKVFSRIPLDPSIVRHEYFHAVIDAVARLPFQGEGGSLNEAFADIFTTFSLGNPYLGEVAYKKANYKRTVINDLKLQDKNGGLYHDSGIISGLFWSLSKELGTETTINLAWEILLRLAPGADFEYFQIELFDVLKTYDQPTQQKARKVLQQRGWIK